VAVETSSGKPYTDNGSIRTIHTQSEEFEWHRDKQDRVITILEGQGWQLQYNGELPIELIEGKQYHIPAMMYHRVIKGMNDLVIDIQE
jgi:quercetin dioxygenase-like cupin family protein